MSIPPASYRDQDYPNGENGEESPELKNQQRKYVKGSHDISRNILGDQILSSSYLASETEEKAMRNQSFEERKQLTSKLNQMEQLFLSLNEKMKEMKKQENLPSINENKMDEESGMFRREIQQKMHKMEESVEKEQEKSKTMFKEVVRLGLVFENVIGKLGNLEAKLQEMEKHQETGKSAEKRLDFLELQVKSLKGDKSEDRIRDLVAEIDKEKYAFKKINDQHEEILRHSMALETNFRTELAKREESFKALHSFVESSIRTLQGSFKQEKYKREEFEDSIQNSLNQVEESLKAELASFRNQQNHFSERLGEVLHDQIKEELKNKMKNSIQKLVSNEVSAVQKAIEKQSKIFGEEIREVAIESAEKANHLSRFIESECQKIIKSFGDRYDKLKGLTSLIAQELKVHLDSCGIGNGQKAHSGKSKSNQRLASAMTSIEGNEEIGGTSASSGEKAEIEKIKKKVDLHYEVLENAIIRLNERDMTTTELLKEAVETTRKKMNQKVDGLMELSQMHHGTQIEKIREIYEEIDTVKRVIVEMTKETQEKFSLFADLVVTIESGAILNQTKLPKTRKNKKEIPEKEAKEEEDASGKPKKEKGENSQPVKKETKEEETGVGKEEDTGLPKEEDNRMGKEEEEQALDKRIDEGEQAQLEREENELEKKPAQNENCNESVLPEIKMEAEEEQNSNVDAEIPEKTKEPIEEESSSSLDETIAKFYKKQVECVLKEEMELLQEVTNDYLAELQEEAMKKHSLEINQQNSQSSFVSNQNQEGNESVPLSPMPSQERMTITKEYLDIMTQKISDVYF